MRIVLPFLEQYFEGRVPRRLHKRLMELGFERRISSYVRDHGNDLRLSIYVNRTAHGQHIDAFVGAVVPSTNVAVADLKKHYPTIGSGWSRYDPKLTSNQLGDFLSQDRRMGWSMAPFGPATLESFGDDVEAGMNKLEEVCSDHLAIRNGIVGGSLHGDATSVFSIPMFMAQRGDLEGFSFMADRILNEPYRNRPYLRDYLRYLSTTYLNGAYAVSDPNDAGPET